MHSELFLLKGEFGITKFKEIGRKIANKLIDYYIQRQNFNIKLRDFYGTEDDSILWQVVEEPAVIDGNRLDTVSGIIQFLEDTYRLNFDAKHPLIVSVVDNYFKFLREKGHKFDK